MEVEMSSKWRPDAPTPAEVPAEPTTNPDPVARIKALQRAFILLLGWIGDQGHIEVIGDVVDSLRKIEHKLRLHNHDDHEVAALRQLADLIEQATSTAHE